MDKDGKKWECHRDSCYHFPLNEVLTKPEADNKCQQLGAHVVAVETAEEHEVVVEIMNNYGMLIHFDYCSSR